MSTEKKLFNLALSGGGIKGLAYVGVFETAEKRGCNWANIAGVSAGALAGAYLGAGYKAGELRKILEGFDFKGLKIREISDRIPVIESYMGFCKDCGKRKDLLVEHFMKATHKAAFKFDLPDILDGILRNIVTFSKDGALFDGDLLEEWVSGVLRKKGIVTFGDLRGGRIEKMNPNGYKMRMTAVDATREKIIVLPDDIAYYGIEPDKLEVAKAVRMSCSVPFAFKPVELKAKHGILSSIHYMIDGGVFDNFPHWVLENKPSSPVIGFRLNYGRNNKLISLDTPLNVLKVLISFAHDIGVPKNIRVDINRVVDIDTSRISFLDFDLSEPEKKYLYENGKTAAQAFFNSFKF